MSYKPKLDVTKMQIECPSAVHHFQRNVRHLLVTHAPIQFHNTVNSEIFAKILFSRTALKDIFAK